MHNTFGPDLMLLSNKCMAPLNHSVRQKSLQSRGFCQRVTPHFYIGSLVFEKNVPMVSIEITNHVEFNDVWWRWSLLDRICNNHM